MTRDFRLLWLGETTSLLGSSVASVALPLVAIVTLHAGTFTVAMLSAVAWLPWLFLGLPAGAWTDRLAQRPVMLASDAVSLVVFASVPIAAWFGVLTIAHLLIAALLGGCAKVFFRTAYNAYLPALLAGDELPAANARLQGSEEAANIVGPGVAGLIAQVFGAVSGVLVDALSFGVSALCLRSMSTSGHRPLAAQRTKLRSEIAEGMRFLAGDPYMRVLTCFGAVSNIALTGATSISVLFLVRDIGTLPGTAGLLMAFGGVGGVCGALLSGKFARRFGTARAMVLSEVFAAPFLLLLGLTQAGFGLLFFVVGLFAICLGVCVSNILAVTFRQQYCPPELRGRVNASGSVVNYGTIPLGALLGGALGSSLGVRETLLLMGGLQILSTGILLLSPLRRLRNFPTAAERSPLRLPQPR